MEDLVFVSTSRPVSVSHTLSFVVSSSLIYISLVNMDDLPLAIFQNLEPISAQAAMFCGMQNVCTHLFAPYVLSLSFNSFALCMLFYISTPIFTRSCSRHNRSVRVASAMVLVLQVIATSMEISRCIRVSRQASYIPKETASSSRRSEKVLAIGYGQFTSFLKPRILDSNSLFLSFILAAVTQFYLLVKVYRLSSITVARSMKASCIRIAVLIFLVALIVVALVSGSVAAW